MDSLYESWLRNRTINLSNTVHAYTHLTVCILTRIELYICENDQEMNPIMAVTFRTHEFASKAVFGENTRQTAYSLGNHVLYAHVIMAPVHGWLIFTGVWKRQL